MLRRYSKNNLLQLSLIALATCVVVPAWGEELKCEAGKGQFTDALSLKVEKGNVAGFSYFSTAGEYTCEVKAQRGDKETKWTDQGNATKVQFEEGVAVIEKSANAYKVRLDKLPRSYYCGMNGQMAEEVTITRHNKKCKVK